MLPVSTSCVTPFCPATTCMLYSLCLRFIHLRPRFIPEGLVETSQIFLRKIINKNDLAMRNTAEVTGDKPFRVAFYDIHVYSFMFIDHRPTNK
jgi:hypothetical protein